MKDRLELLYSKKKAEKEINERINLGKELREQPVTDMIGGFSYRVNDSKFDKFVNEVRKWHQDNHAILAYKLFNSESLANKEYPLDPQGPIVSDSYIDSKAYYGLYVGFIDDKIECLQNILRQLKYISVSKSVEETHNEPVLKSSEMKRIWGENYEGKKLIFFSHKANYKKQISNAKKELEKERFSCFIAHEDIEPTLDWKNEIIKALNTMHIFVGVVTDDFHKGSWTDQEIGYACSRGVPKVFVKIGSDDPKGFVASEQALTANWNNLHIRLIEHLERDKK